MSVVYRDPWWELQEPAHRDSLQRQYDREITETHALWNAQGRVVGKSGANDDVLVALPDGRFAVVHLTWSSKPGGADWPSATFYNSAAEVSAEIALQNVDYG